MKIALIRHGKPYHGIMRKITELTSSGGRKGKMSDSLNPVKNIIGQRILITGNSCSGKSTFGSLLASVLNVPFVELDALNWEPKWVGLNDTNPDELIRRFQKATEGDSWVAAGSYTTFSQRAFWPKLESIVWLDLPLHHLVWRMFKRSWQRWRTKELLWGTNYEKFWPQLMFWRKEESLLWWIVSQYQPKRKKMFAYQTDPRWSHIRFIRLCSTTEVSVFESIFYRPTEGTGSNQVLHRTSR